MNKNVTYFFIILFAVLAAEFIMHMFLQHQARIQQLAASNGN